MTGLTAEHIHLLDQESASINEIIDQMVADTREIIAPDAEPNVVAQLIAIRIERERVDPGKLATFLGYVLVRLAGQDGGAS